MDNKINTLFDYIKTLSESDLDWIIKFVLGIVSVNRHSEDLPHCPYCGGTHVVKYGHKNKKQRFMCHKVLMALHDLLEKNPVFLSGIAEFDETFN